MSGRAIFPLIALGLLLASACRPGDPAGGSAEQQSPAPRQSRTLVLISGAELPSFAPKPLTPEASSARAGIGKATLNALLVYNDIQGVPQPFLAEALPQLDTDTWRVSPDGKMETYYRLKPDLTWHDGQALTAEDFVFAHQVYATPEFGVAESAGFRSIEEVRALDGRTILIRWKERYFEAGQVAVELPPLPRHILQRSYQESPGSFIGLPYWTFDYVGLGPWKLERREPGAFFEARAFDGFVFGRPRIDRVRVMYQIDPNVVVATMLAGEAHLTDSALLHGDDGMTLERAWTDSKAGVVQWTTDIGKVQEFQGRPEFAVPTQIATDARVRQALAFAIDRVTLAEICTAGKGLLREIYSHPNADYYESLLRAVPHRYPYDPRRAEQLLLQAGFARGGDGGGWRTPTGERFTFAQYGLGGTTDEKDSAIIIESLSRFGIDATSHVFATARSSQEERAKISGMLNGSNPLPDRYHSRNAAGPENRWTGANRYGFVFPELDGYIEGYLNTVDRSERIRNLAQMERIAMEQMPAIPTYYHAVVIAHAASLKGVARNLLREGGIERMMWTWEWQ